MQKTTQSELDQEGNEVDNVPASSSSSSSCRHWLLRLLSTHAREAEAYAISLKDIFPAVDCHTLFLPSVRRAHLADLSTATEADLTEEYRAERDALLEKLRTGAVPKRLKKHLGPRKITGEDEEGGEEFTGTELAVLLRVLVGAANAGSLTDIPNRWDAFLEQLQVSSGRNFGLPFQDLIPLFSFVQIEIGRRGLLPLLPGPPGQPPLQRCGGGKERRRRRAGQSGE